MGSVVLLVVFSLEDLLLEVLMETRKFDPVLSVWNITNESEKRRVVQQFLQKHGEYYTKRDFIRFLRKKYRGPISSNTPSH